MGGEELVREHRMIRSDGRLVWISARTAQLRDKAGTIEGYIVTCTDITELKEANRALEEAEARFANAFEEAPIGMALVSPEGGFLRVNRELVRITGHTQEQLLEMSVQDVSHPDELDETLDLVRRLLAGDIEDLQPRAPPPARERPVRVDRPLCICRAATSRDRCTWSPRSRT